MAGAREQLRDEEEEHDLAGELRVNALARLEAQGGEDERTATFGHGHAKSATRDGVHRRGARCSASWSRCGCRRRRRSRQPSVALTAAAGKRLADGGADARDAPGLLVRV